MPENLIFLSIPGLRPKDLAAMPELAKLTAGGQVAELVPSFPCVTCPVQANMTTGTLARDHGVVANGFYFRDTGRIEMWTSPNDCITRPQIWESLAAHDAGLTSAVWFPLHSKKSKANYVCTPAPIHNPDGSESLWCYTLPPELYGTLRDVLGHFPLKHFWGPLAGIPASQWIADSAVHAAGQWKPSLFHIYLPHLDYAAQRSGPDSPAAEQAVAELDALLGRLTQGMNEAYGRSLPGSSPASMPSRPSITWSIRIGFSATQGSWPSKRPTRANCSMPQPVRPGPWPITSTPTSLSGTATPRRSPKWPNCSARSRALPKCSSATTWPDTDWTMP